MSRKLTRRVLQALDACRPGTSDRADMVQVDLTRRLANPELADVAGRIERADAAIGGAMRTETPVPDGLAGRLLARLEADRLAHAGVRLASPGAEGAVPLAPPVPAGEATTPVPRPIRWPRRLALAGVAVSVAAAVTVAVVMWFGPPSDLSERAILRQAIDLCQSGLEGSAHDLSSSPADLRFSRDLQKGAARGWHAIEFLGRRAAAYELQGPDGVRATLLVVRREDVRLGFYTPPERPTSSTGDCTAAAWQDGDLVYVLVVHGGERSYQRLLSVQAGPLA